MLKKPNKYIFRLLILSGIVLSLFACSGRPKGIMSSGEMTDFLVELHKLDGTLQVNGKGSSQDRENLYYYNALLKKHGITEAEFDSSLVYYTKNPKKFERIYNQVVDRLSKMDSVLIAENKAIEDSALKANMQFNIWNKATKYTFNKDSARTHLDFIITGSEFMTQDFYILKFKLHIAPEDSCKGQHTILRIHYASGVTDSVTAAEYHDKITRHYSIRFAARRKEKVDRLSGSLLASKSYKGTFHATVDSISLMREFYPSAQDSLRNLIYGAPVVETKEISNRLTSRVKILR